MKNLTARKSKSVKCLQAWEREAKATRFLLPPIVRIQCRETKPTLDTPPELHPDAPGLPGGAGPDFLHHPEDWL